ncbi:MAG: hypothetical protein WCP07_04930 [bacterium]
MPEIETLFILTATVTAIVLLAEYLELSYPVLLAPCGLILIFIARLSGVRLQDAGHRLFL